MEFNWNSNTIRKAREFAISKHGNQRYADHHYSRHLADVFGVLKEYTPELSKEFNLTQSQIDILAAGCWLHDVMEDCPVKYEILEKEFGTEVADIVLVVTMPQYGKKASRKLRYLDKLVQNQMALIVKLCDRIANTRFSLQTSRDSGKPNYQLKKYRGEWPIYNYFLNDGKELQSFFTELETLSTVTL